MPFYTVPVASIIQTKPFVHLPQSSGVDPDDLSAVQAYVTSNNLTSVVVFYTGDDVDDTTNQTHKWDVDQDGDVLPDITPTGAQIATLLAAEPDTNIYTDAEQTKLAGIDVGATDNQTGAEIKALYEAEADTNAFTDAEQTKLAGIDTGATDDQTGAEIKALYEAEADTNAFTDAEQTKLAAVEANATADQTGAEIKALYEAEADTNAFTDAEQTKLAGIDTGATDDQTGAEIKAAYEAEADTNAFTDAEQTKLAGIDTGATDDQTGAEIKALYEAEADTNAFTDAEQTKLAGIETGATGDMTGAEIKVAYEAEADTNAFTDAEQTKLAGIEALADVTDAANVDAAGAVMLTDASTAGMAFVADEDNMASNSDTLVPTQQSVVSYIALQLGPFYQTPTSLDVGGGATFALPTGEAAGVSYIIQNAQAGGTALGTANPITVEDGDVVWVTDGVTSSTDDGADFEHIQALNAVQSVSVGGGSAQTGVVNIANATTLVDGAMSAADKVKLDAVEAGADVTDAASVDAAGATMNTDTDVSGNAWVIDEDSMVSDDATKVPTQQSVKAYVDAATGGTGTDLTYTASTRELASSTGLNATLPEVVAAGDSGLMTGADKTKLDGVDSGATDDQTGAEIKAAYEAEANTNAFTDAEQTKLGGIEAAADVTDAANVDAAGAVMESDTTTASMGFVIDEDNMASDLDTRVPTQQSVKAYADNNFLSSVNIAASRLALRKAVNPIAPAATIDWDLDNGLVQTITGQTGAWTLNFPSNAAAGETAIIYVDHDGTGVTLGGGAGTLESAGGAGITLGSGTGKDRIEFFFDTATTATVSVTTEIA